MTTGTIILIIVAILLVLVGAWYLLKGKKKSTPSQPSE